MPKNTSSLIELFRIPTPAAVLALTAATSFLHAEEDMSKPEIKVEKKKDADGRESVYMYIDGVKVHETDTTKQPLPKVVSPGKMLGAPPSDAVVLFDGSAESFDANWTDTKGGPSKWKVADEAMESVRGRIRAIEKNVWFMPISYRVGFSFKSAGPWPRARE